MRAGLRTCGVLQVTDGDVRVSREARTVGSRGGGREAGGVHWAGRDQGMAVRAGSRGQRIGRQDSGPAVSEVDGRWRREVQEVERGGCRG